MRTAKFVSILASFFLSNLVSAAPPAPTEAPTAEELTQIIRGIVLPSLPKPLVEQNFHWGKQKNVAVGLKWERNGILLVPELQKKMHNNGIWRKIEVEADHPESSLKIYIRDIQIPEKGKLTFSACINLQTNIKFEQQIWRAGTRFYSGETRARARVMLKLNCESTSKFEKATDALLPDYVFRLRITSASLNYDNFVCEHTAGVGGEAARILGDAVHDTINQWKPSLERKLLNKANEKIVKVADTKEVRLSLSKLLEGGSSSNPK